MRTLVEWNPRTKRLETIELHTVFDGTPATARQLFADEHPRTHATHAPDAATLTHGEIKAMVTAALKTDAYSVAELAGLVGVDTDRIWAVIASLRPHLVIVDRQRQVQRRGRVYVNVYRYRRGGGGRVVAPGAES